MRSSRLQKVEQWIQLAENKVPHVFIKCSAHKRQQLMAAMRRQLPDFEERDLVAESAIALAAISVDVLAVNVPLPPPPPIYVLPKSVLRTLIASYT